MLIVWILFVVTITQGKVQHKLISNNFVNFVLNIRVVLCASEGDKIQLTGIDKSLTTAVTQRFIKIVIFFWLEV